MHERTYALYCVPVDIDLTVCVCRPLLLSQVVSISIQIASALSFLHEHGHLHGDLKHSNIGVSESQGTIIVKLLDLGLVKQFGQTSTDSCKLRLAHPGQMP